MYVEGQYSFGGGTCTVRSQISLLALQPPSPKSSPSLGAISSVSGGALGHPGQGVPGVGLSEGFSSGHQACGRGWSGPPSYLRVSRRPGQAEARGGLPSLCLCMVDSSPSLGARQGAVERWAAAPHTHLSAKGRTTVHPRLHYQGGRVQARLLEEGVLKRTPRSTFPGAPFRVQCLPGGTVRPIGRAPQTCPCCL